MNDLPGESAYEPILKQFEEGTIDVAELGRLIASVLSKEKLLRNRTAQEEHVERNVLLLALGLLHQVDPIDGRGRDLWALPEARADAVLGCMRDALPGENN